MNVRVIPIKAWGLIFWNSDAVFERRTRGAEDGFQRVIFMAGWRNGHAVEMQVGIKGGHHSTSTRIGDDGSIADFGVYLRTSRRLNERRRRGRDFILQHENKSVAGVQP